MILHIFKPDGSRKQMPLKPGRYLMGRKEGATIRLPFPSVSREHCEVVFSGSALGVRDLNSSNGTLRNRERVSESPLSAGDILEVGPVKLIVQVDGKPAMVEPPSPPLDELDETPPAGMAARESGGSAGTKLGDGKPGGKPKSGGDESSVFDFDFDLDDDDKPGR